MTVTSIIVAGIEIPSRDPAFLAVVAVHVLFGLAGTITGVTAMLSPKEPQTQRPSSLGRYDLLLVSDGSIRDCGRSGRCPLGRRLSLDHSRNAGFCGRTPGSHGAPEAVEQLGEAAYHRHGDVVHFSADRVLCGQRKEPAGLERSPSGRLLARARCGWDPVYCSCAVMASVGADRQPPSQPYSTIRELLCRPVGRLSTYTSLRLCPSLPPRPMARCNYMIL